MYYDETPKSLQNNNCYKELKAWHATYALMKFCKSHKCAKATQINKFQVMLIELERINYKEAVAIGATIATGRLNGCFDDVFIEPKDESEDPASVETTFHALVAYWRDSIGNPPWSNA